MRVDSDLNGAYFLLTGYNEKVPGKSQAPIVTLELLGNTLRAVQFEGHPHGVFFSPPLVVYA